MSIIKECITCRKQGHTYLECTKVSFFSLLSGCMEVEPFTGPSLSDTRIGIEKLNSERSQE